MRVKCRYSAYRNASKKVIWAKLAAMLKEMGLNEERLEPVARKQMQSSRLEMATFFTKAEF